MSVHKRILGYLREDCSSYRDEWCTSCIYGKPADNSDADNSDADNSEFKIDENLLMYNFCGVTPKLSRSLCEGCKRNFKKIAQNLHQLEELASNWYGIDFDESIENPYEIKKIQNRQTWEAKHKDFVYDTTWKVMKFHSYFDENLTPLLEKLKDVDVIDLGWYFNQDITPLTELPNLKGLIFGHWFNQSLNPLAQCENIQFILVRYSYNKPLVKEVYDKTFWSDKSFG
jgi:hypothetical protein